MDRARDRTIGLQWIGRARQRTEDASLVRGAGRFIDDLAPADCLHIQFLRSTEAHGRIALLDVTAARAAPGVALVLTGADFHGCKALSVNPLLEIPALPKGDVLPVDEINAVGQPVAAAVATSLAAALDAIERIGIRVDPLPLWPATGNDVFVKRIVAGDADKAFASAARIVTVENTHSRLAPAALEPRVAMASADPGGALTVWLATQAPHRARTELAGALGIAEENIRVIAPDVGGAFGGKASLYPEDVVVAMAALRLCRPVKWVATRSEDFQTATQGRGASCNAALALDEAGRFIGLRAEFDFPLGGWLPFSAVVPARNAGRILPGPYEISDIDVTVRGRRQNTAAVSIYRGAGRPEAAMLMERLVDKAARELALDPIELRERNVPEPERFPLRTASGEIIDSGNFPLLLARARERAGYGDLIAARNRRRGAGDICGVGTALYLEPAGQGWESATVSLAADGTIVAATGTTAQGQGRATAFAQIVADAIGLDPSQIRVDHGDTATCPPGIGALASRSTAIGGSAIFEAAEKFRETARLCAARLLQQPVEQIALVPDGFEVFGMTRCLSWRDLAAAIHADGGLPSGFASGLASATVYHADGEAWSSGCCLAAVSIDGETGELRIDKLVWIDDSGTVVNPMLVRGQCFGGMAQGLGEALLERIVYDEAGQLVTASLMDYALPRARDIPALDLGHIETPSPFNLLGAKGVGEAGCIGIPAAIANAALDALAPHGITHLDMPLTSEKIWKLLNNAAQ